MQISRVAFEREASRRIPGMLGEMLDEPVAPAMAAPAGRDSSVDLVLADERGRRWLLQLKAASGPGLVRGAAEQLRHYRASMPEAVPLLVVPYMSPAGAKAAQGQEINWIDLSGNARIRVDDANIRMEGRPNRYRSVGRPSSPFAPKSARVARELLIEPDRWWRQKDLVGTTGIDDGNVSRIVRRLDEELLLERRERELRPRDPDLLLDAWEQDYRFDGHDIVTGHLSGTGIDLARKLAEQLDAAGLRHAFTGMPAAWALDHFARFRLTTVYVEGDPRNAADHIDMRPTQSGANVQLVGPNDNGVFAGEQDHDSLRCVAPVQIYLDLLHLPERAAEAAGHLRAEHLQHHARTR